MNRVEKEQVIADLVGRAQRASIAIVTEYKGMTVEQMTELRAKLRESGVEYQVVKNTLARIALTNEGSHSVIANELKETNAIAWGFDDPVAAAKVLSDYLKANPKTKLALKFASLEGKFLDAANIKELSTLPGREELLAKLLGTMNAVPQNFVGLLANVLRGLLNVLAAVKDQKEEAA